MNGADEKHLVILKKSRADLLDKHARHVREEEANEHLIAPVLRDAGGLANLEDEVSDPGSLWTRYRVG